MKKKIFYLFLTIVSVVSLIGCGNSESSEEASEPVSATQGNALESAFLSDDHFELREESITIEYGTPLSDDISEYVIAKDYEGITCEYEEISAYDMADGKCGTATFINATGNRLFMDVYYTDTTPPTITQTEYTYYTLYEDSNNKMLYEKMGPQRELYYEIEEYVDGFNFDTFKTCFGINDNATCHFSSIWIDNNLFYDSETAELTGNWNFIPLDYGTHSLVITVYDLMGNTETFECTLHIVADVSPEERAEMITNGYTEEQINTAVEEYVSQMEN